MGLKMRYFPKKIVETSTLLKQKMIYVDAGVQRSFGAIAYFRYGFRAYVYCLNFLLSKRRVPECVISFLCLLK